MPPATRIRAKLRRGDFRLDVDLAWDERVAVIFGPSGSGKTTLFEIVLGLHPEARARVELGGMALDDPDRGIRVALERRGLGWVPQEPSLFPHLSVRDNLRFGRSRAGEGGDREFERAVDVLEIGDLLSRPVGGLSGGERQRVAIARALASGPRALLMDEPLAALDLPLRARVLPYLLRVRDELDIPILYITHDPDEALIVGELVAVLDAGRCVALGPPREVLWSRAVLPLSEALGLENVFDARVIDSAGGEATVATAGGLRLVIPVRLADGEQVRIGLRAEDVLLAGDRPARISASNVIEATVERCEPRDSACRVHLMCGEKLVAKVTPAAAEKLGLRPGASVYAVIKAQALRRIA